VCLCLHVKEQSKESRKPYLAWVCTLYNKRTTDILQHPGNTHQRRIRDYSRHYVGFHDDLLGHVLLDGRHRDEEHYQADGHVHDAIHHAGGSLPSSLGQRSDWR
jgi:hypothetical protein